MATRIAYNLDGTIGYGLTIDVSRTQIAAASMGLIDSDATNTGYANPGAKASWAFNFPASLTISSILLRTSTGTVSSIEVSSNATEGYLSTDGDWTTIHETNISQTDLISKTTTIESPAAGTWVRINFSAAEYLYNLQIFGEYAAPNFEVYDTAGTPAELTGDYPLSLNNAANNAAYTDYAEFKIKNIDASAHTYTVYVLPVKYGGDSAVTSYFSIAHDSDEDEDWTKILNTDGSTGYTTASVAAGEFSIPLRVYADFSAVQNPADGYHQYVVKVVEAS